MNVLRRGLKGAILGASFAAAVAVIVTTSLFGFQIVVIDDPLDRARDLSHLADVLRITVTAGLAVGALAGLVAKLPRKGVRMLTSISIVAGCAVLTRLFSAAQPRFKGSPEPSYLPAIVGALVASVFVLVYGVVVTRRSASGVIVQSPCTADKKDSDSGGNGGE
jgi:hypothetical protein